MKKLYIALDHADDCFDWNDEKDEAYVNVELIKSLFPKENIDFEHLVTWHPFHAHTEIAENGHRCVLIGESEHYSFWSADVQEQKDLGAQ